MSFGVASQGPTTFGVAANAAGGPHAQTGPPLGEITTENLSFHALAGDVKLQLFSNGWPSDSPPPPTASLLSINSAKGLIAAASPESVIVATTAAIREAFSGAGDAGGNTKTFTPPLTITPGTRISQVAFSSDGLYLAISAEIGGGLAVYESQMLLGNSTQSSFELGTDQVPLRALVPNPAPESAHMFAVVTMKGNLMIADMKARSFINGQGGQVLKSGVSCVSWSNKGKQLVAGLGNGTAFQMSPDGVGKADIPRPPDLQGEKHTSSVLWLENDLFLMAYTPSASDEGMPPPTDYFLLSRQAKTQNYAFQSLPEACSPFGFNRQPSAQFIQRLRSFPPGLTDAVIVASTSSDDVCLYTRASQPLSAETPASDSRDVFALTTMADDSRRAAVPMAENMMDSTSTIGMALDLSSTSKVFRPIPGDEIEESPGPLPAMFLLNHMGILAGWWIVYSDSIRQGTIYPGMTSEQSQGKPQAAPGAFGTTSGQVAATPFGAAAQQGVPAASAFGNPGNINSFGGGAFGSTTISSNQPSPWSGTSATASFGQSSFGQPAFGTTSTIGSANQATAFGSTSSLGTKPALWGSSSQSQPQSSQSGTAFGQTSMLGSQRPLPFGSTTSSTASAPAFGASLGGGFASFAGGGGFAAAASNAPKSGGMSIFRQSGGNTFEAKSTESSFGIANQSSSAGAFGAPSSQGFNLGSSWTKTAPPPLVESKNSQGSVSLFGSGFSTGFATALDEAKNERAPLSKEADMMSDQEEFTAQIGTANQGSSNATGLHTLNTDSGGLSEVKSDKFATFTHPTASGQLFGTGTSSNEPTKENESNLNTSTLKGREPAITSSQDSPTLFPEKAKDAQSTTAATSTDTMSQKEPKATTRLERSPPEPPLPPDPTSKASYTPGTSSSSSVSVSKPSLEEPPLPSDSSHLISKNQTNDAEDAPLPPDFVKGTSTVSPRDDLKETDGHVALPPEASKSGTDPLPASDGSDLDDEGSGVDVAQEINAGNELSPNMSPESSFGTDPERQPASGSFQKIRALRESSSKSLFGEISSSAIPKLPPKMLASPRSPSPVRLGSRSSLRTDAIRSVSAPGDPRLVPGTRRVSTMRPSIAHGLHQPIIADSPSEDERTRASKQKVLQQAEADQQLSDGEDERTRDYLEEEVPASLELESFIAHQDYVGQVTKPGIPGQVERVYRDINSMVDTLGLNARALATFIKGHEELYFEQGRTRSDLDTGEAWTLAEIDGLIEIQENLQDDLVSSELQDPLIVINACAEILKDLSRLRARQGDIKHTVDASLDPKLLEALRTAPLSTEQSSMRHDLRAKYASLQHALSQCEEAVSMLKAKTTTVHSAKAKSDSSKLPTVEAVEKTILKMTSMFEKRSGDIDVLEAQMRQLNASGTTNVSREQSPFMTPPPSKRGFEASSASSINGRSFYTPGSRKSGLAASIGASFGRLSLTNAKKTAETDDMVAQEYAKKAARKRQVRMVLKDALVAGDIRVRTLDDL